MISNISDENGVLSWDNMEEHVEYKINNGTYVCDDYHVLIMSEDRKRVLVINESGNRVDEIHNTDDVYLMYLIRHPQFGLSIAASVKKQDGEWRDRYLTYTKRGFIENSELR